jgi:hypothetical protein
VRTTPASRCSVSVSPSASPVDVLEDEADVSADQD